MRTLSTKPLNISLADCKNWLSNNNLIKSVLRESRVYSNYKSIQCWEMKSGKIARRLFETTQEGSFNDR